MGEKERCDLCWSKGNFLKFDHIAACEGCLRRAVKFAYDAACTFGGTHRQDETPAPPPAPAGKPREEE